VHCAAHGQCLTVPVLYLMEYKRQNTVSTTADFIRVCCTKGHYHQHLLELTMQSWKS